MKLFISVFIAAVIFYFIIRLVRNDHKQQKDIKLEIRQKTSDSLTPVDTSKSGPSIPGRTYRSLEDWEKDTKVAWKKDREPLKLSFTYEKWDRLKEKYIKENRSVNVEEIIREMMSLADIFYLSGRKSCSVRGGFIATNNKNTTMRFCPYCRFMKDSRPMAACPPKRLKRWPWEFAT